MLWAIVDDKKIEPIPKTHGACPLCGGKVLSKCGEIKVWHWAHFKNENCDSWFEPESYWHQHWKMTFGKENSEIVIKKEVKWHIADILTNEKVVIELQNSPIQKTIIKKREEFYGDRMMWLINGNKFKENFFIKDLDDDSHWWGYAHDSTKSKEGKKEFQWDYPRQSWKDVQRNLFIDFGEETLFWVKEGMGEKRGMGIFVSKEDFIMKYGGDYKKHLSLFRNYTLKLNRKNLRIKGIEEKNMHLITSIKYKGNARSLEIYFENMVDIFKIEKLQKVIINGTLNFEKKNQNLQLVNSKIIE